MAKGLRFLEAVGTKREHLSSTHLPVSHWQHWKSLFIQVAAEIDDLREAAIQGFKVLPVFVLALVGSRAYQCLVPGLNEAELPDQSGSPPLRHLSQAAAGTAAAPG